MKKLLSVLLVLVLVLSVAATSTLNAGATSVEETDPATSPTLSAEETSIEETIPATIAPSVEVADLAANSPLNTGVNLFDETDLSATKSFRVFFSDRPYQEIEKDSAVVYGFLGDGDGDGLVSIIDCTAIQLYLAGLGSLCDNAPVVADVDRDGEISVLDATEIQLWKAYLSNNANIAHSVYCLSMDDNAKDDFFTIIISYLKENGKYNKTDKCYTLQRMRLNKGFTDNLTISYYVEADNIMLFQLIESDDLTSSISSEMYFNADNSTFDFSSYEYNLVEDYSLVYKAQGKGKINNFDSYKIDTTCSYFEAAASSSFSDIKQNIESQMCTMLADTDKLFFYEFPFYFGQIVNSK